jgi:hypothetical protein
VRALVPTAAAPSTAARGVGSRGRPGRTLLADREAIVDAVLALVALAAVEHVAARERADSRTSMLSMQMAQL